MKFTESFPDPLVPADVDLRDFGFMPLDVLRLRDSDLAIEASAEIFRCSVLLWCAAWHQVPAGSLPNKDRTLADYSRAWDRWPKIKAEVLAEWVECSDGRLYHPVVAEKAIKAKAEKDAQRARTANATAARAAKQRHRDDPPPSPPDGPRDGTPDDVPHDPPHDATSEQRDVAHNEVQGKGREGKGRERRADGGPPIGVARASESEELEDLEPPPAWIDQPPPQPTAYGPIAKAMRQAGLADAHPGDLKFRTLVDQGATVEEFVVAAEAAVGQRKPFAWALAAVIGKRRDAAAVQLAPSAAAPSKVVDAWKPEPLLTAEQHAEQNRKRLEAMAKLGGSMRLKAVG